MSIKIKGPNGNGPVQGAPNMEFAYRSLVSSSRQKLFEKVLNQARSNGEESSKQEINSLQKEIKGLQTAQTKSQKIDRMREGNSTQSQRTNAQANGVLSDLSTSALLRLAAFSPQRGTTLGGGYYKNAVGTGALGRALPRGTTDSSRSGAVDPSQDFQGPGSLSARFESGDNGVGTIGYDDGGGTSYGVYQIASRVGTMRHFLDYLDDHAPKWAARLRSAGHANTGSTNGAMPREWKKIAAEDPERFEELQHEFIHETHYLPAMEEISRRTGFDVAKQSRAVQEVLWSTAVQHGPKGAANIFCKAIDKGALKGTDLAPQNLISSVYSSRAKYVGSMTPGIRDAVWQRFQEEKSLALAMLADDGGSTEARA